MNRIIDVSAGGTNRGLVSYTHVMYLLHAIGVAIGILTAASIVGYFLFSLPSIAAVVMNLVRRGDARGTWLESHFRWQLRTFLWALAWSIVAVVLFGWLVLLLIGIPLLAGSFFLIGAWVAYRVIRGWLALRDGRAVPALSARALSLQIAGALRLPSQSVAAAPLRVLHPR